MRKAPAGKLKPGGGYGLIIAHPPPQCKKGGHSILALKGKMTHRVELGSDARGNLVRIENVLDKIPERLTSTKAQLENLFQQQEAAKVEVAKPFPYEQELAEKTARLVELDQALNLDGRSQPQQVQDQEIAKSARPSMLARLREGRESIPSKGPKKQRAVERSTSR